ncbi:hypothetical protein [Spiroplasma floricola]|uniref:Uncharacterized protein n=1 Tax=Spiroplasma floricola 23-6 TaxID=1336749 RepID=A0A2K8SD46_9MOLU|nr:hypothetical protein [Spiroplasma floricola]AUB31245.1 hypothetical protein SFLOR_v1c01840 [Spiroplasma floricola 23-6]
MKFKKTFSYIFRSTLISAWTYIFVIFIPVIVCTSLYFIFLKNLILIENKEKLIAFSLLPLILMSFFACHFLITWRETIFLRQISNFGITKMCFFINFFFVFTLYSFISYFITNLFLLIFDLTLSIGNYKKILFDFNDIGGAFIFILAMFLMILLYFSISFLIAGNIKNVYLINSSVFIIIVLTFIFSDFFLESSLYQSPFSGVISFLSPQKYLNWIFYLTYSGGFLDQILIYKFITKIESTVYFYNLLIPILSSLFYIFSLSILSFIFFTNSLKK